MTHPPPPHVPLLETRPQLQVKGALSHAPSRGPLWGTTYHQEVVKQEDFSLVQSEFLRLIWVWNLKEPAVADQPPMGQREHLWGEGSPAVSPLPLGRNPGSTFETQPVRLASENALSHQPRITEQTRLAS